MIELKPCPCCGAPGEMMGPTPVLDRFWVQCVEWPRCGLQTRTAATEQAAADRWNRRQPAPPVPELEGAYPLVLYFKDRTDVGIAVEIFKAALPNLMESKIP